MAKVINNIILQGLSGTVGNMVFSQMPDGSTRVSAKPVKRRRKRSPAQKDQQKRLKAAAQYASKACKEEPVYAALARGKNQNAFNVAVADFFRPPVIHAIERGEGVVRVTASDNVMVTRVTVQILDGKGKVLEQGQAAQPDPRRYPALWEYPTSAEGTVEAAAWDLADNPRDAKVYKFNQVLDQLLLEFVHTKLDLYKKLTEPKVNEMLKRQWFEVLAIELGGR